MSCDRKFGFAKSRQLAGIFASFLKRFCVQWVNGRVATSGGTSQVINDVLWLVPQNESIVSLVFLYEVLSHSAHRELEMAPLCGGTRYVHLWSERYYSSGSSRGRWAFCLLPPRCRIANAPLSKVYRKKGFTTSADLLLINQCVVTIVVSIQTDCYEYSVTPLHDVSRLSLYGRIGLADSEVDYYYPSHALYRKRSLEFIGTDAFGQTIEYAMRDGVNEFDVERLSDQLPGHGHACDDVTNDYHCERCIQDSSDYYSHSEDDYDIDSESGQDWPQAEDECVIN
uniref:Uncharacterized protein n=1 Tax=viral metagenome TaxID=1070528 RepID=A0A2V0RAA0_9ZZZZ